jgi:hypothetical protein
MKMLSRKFIQSLFAGIAAAALLSGCQSAPAPEVQRVVYDGGRRSLDLTIVADHPRLAKRWRNGRAVAINAADGWVTLQIHGVSGVGPVAYRWQWHAASGMTATNPATAAWRRLEAESGHPVVMSGTSSIPYPAQAVLQLRFDH